MSNEQIGVDGEQEGVEKASKTVLEPFSVEVDTEGARNGKKAPMAVKRKTKRGRPKKTEVAQYKQGNRGKVGRPAGDAAIIQDYKSRMLASPKSAKVLEKIFDAALTDGHPGQTAAWKLVIDRIAPVSAFDVSKTGSEKPQISINISTIGATPTVETVDNAQDVSFREVENDQS